MWTHLSPSPRHSCVAPAHMKSPRTALALLLFLLLLAARLRGLARKETEVTQTAVGSDSTSREPRPELGDVLAELQHRREEVGRACREHRTELGRCYAPPHRLGLASRIAESGLCGLFITIQQCNY